jgi:predicted  nucleic acid-binding Zn-ribbon protein
MLGKKKKKSQHSKKGRSNKGTKDSVSMKKDTVESGKTIGGHRSPLENNKNNESSIDKVLESILENIKKIDNKTDDSNKLIYKLIGVASSGDELKKAENEILQLKGELQTTQKQKKFADDRINDLEREKKDLENEINTLGKSSTEINNILESSLEGIKQNKTELVEKIIGNCKNKIDSSFYVLFLLERLSETKKLEKEHPNQSSKIFQSDYEGHIAQLISFNICEAYEKNDSDLNEVNKLIDYANDKLEKWEILPIEDPQYFIKENHESTGKTEANSRIRKYFTLPIKIKSHSLEHTELKKALVDAK